MEPNTQYHSEAPFSMTTKVVYDGYDWLVTFRAGVDEDVAREVWRTATGICSNLKDAGAVPVIGNAYKAALQQRLAANGPTPAQKLAPISEENLPPAEPELGGNGEDSEVVAVTRLVAKVTSTGKRHLKVFGGRWKKFGVTAWKEVADVLLDLEKCDLGTELPVEAGLHAVIQLVDGKPKRVTDWLDK